MPVNDPKSVNDILTLLQSAPLKRYGQNFLIDPAVRQAIINQFNPQPLDEIVEIGPGLGSLTGGLLETGAQVTAIEIDHKLSAFLEQTYRSNQNFKVVNENVLRVKFDQFAKPIRLISNLPYNITTEVLEKAIKESSNIRDFLFMVQKEVIPRLIAKPGDENYGPLAIGFTIFGEGKRVLNVAREAFFPQPNVTSAVYYVRFTHQYDAKTVQGIFRLIKALFLSRRKTIFNNLAAHLGDKVLATALLEKLAIALNTRPEDLAPSFYHDLYFLIEK